MKYNCTFICCAYILYSCKWWISGWMRYKVTEKEWERERARDRDGNEIDENITSSFVWLFLFFFLFYSNILYFDDFDLKKETNRKHDPKLLMCNIIKKRRKKEEKN